jgi:hypothetical protein
MKKVITLFLFMNLAFADAAQVLQLSGKILENNNNPVEFADVFLMQNDSILRYELTDENGKFLVNTTQRIYTLYVKQLGDTLYHQNINRLPDRNSVTN